MTDLTRAVWRKSSRSQQNGQCVELANTQHLISVRDSKNADGPVLAFGQHELTGFLATIKAGHFDL